MRRRDLTKTLLASAAAVGTTRAESAADNTPSPLIYAASPRIDPRRYGAVGDGKADDTHAMQTTLNAAQASNGRITIPDDFRMSCGPLTLTISGEDALSNSLAIEGMSMVGSRIIAQPDLRAPLLTLKSRNPSSQPQPAQLVLENFSLYNHGNSKTPGGHGLSLQGLAWVRLSGLQVNGFDIGLQMVDSLTTLMDQQCQFCGNNMGVAISRRARVQIANLISLYNCRISANSQWGVSFSGGSQFVMRGCNLEENGSPNNAASGAFVSGSDLSANFGFARIELYENWFEANHGLSVNIQPLTSGLMALAIEGGQIIASEAGQALAIGAPGKAVHQVMLKNIYSPSAGDTWQIFATYLTLINTLAGNLHIEAAHHTYINALSASGLLT
jgi:hypothetical protein